MFSCSYVLAWGHRVHGASGRILQEVQPGVIQHLCTLVGLGMRWPFPS